MGDLWITVAWKSVLVAIRNAINWLFSNILREKKKQKIKTQGNISPAMLNMYEILQLFYLMLKHITESLRIWSKCLTLDCLCVCVCLLTQSFPTVCDPVDCSPPGSSIHGIFQARILECVALPSSRAPSQPRDWTRISYVSCIASGFFTTS